MHTVFFSLCLFSPVAAPFYSVLVVSTVLQGRGGYFAGLKGECGPSLPRGYLLTGAAGVHWEPRALLTEPSGQLHTLLASSALGTARGFRDRTRVCAEASVSQLLVVQLLLQVQKCQ